jgi:hypothetical protein
MRLPGGQQLVLRQIERSLLTSDYRLDSQFAIFARSARSKAMPATERLPTWLRPPRRRPARRQAGITSQWP